MKRYGYHRVITPTGEQSAVSPVVVEMSDEGVFLGYRPLLGDEPQVIWVGGTLDLSRLPSQPQKQTD
ncbi:MAG: hypothetical protein II385_07220 [Bacteroidaceae bacterium]|nr:hypothetical protein [Bacteroidaceae bacterium]